MENEKIDIEKARHSLSHILAAAVMEMFPEAKLGIGPAIDNGFYYDFDLPRSLTPADLKQIEKKMRELINQDIRFEAAEKQGSGAAEELKDQPYKLELIKELEEKGQKISFYKSGQFTDLCAGPHVQSSAELKNLGWKLDKIAGAYWRGDEKNKMLQRIYGLAFETKAELEEYEQIRVEAEKRDHKKLGRELELFIFDETAPGMPYWLPKGLAIYNTLIDFWRREHKARGYQEIKSPLINKKDLYVTSGHWEHYREDMFLSETEEGTYALKPMNCPNAMVVYGLKMRSYRDLPLRLSDCDTLHRFELSGTVNGLLRARSFSQDDAHIFIRDDQIESEINNIFEIIEKFYKIFNLEYSFRLSTRPDKFMGDPKVWDRAESILKSVLDKSGKKYIVKEKDGAFYGPKIDILMKDSLKREWQMGTIQLDFQLPQNFKLGYIAEDGKEKTPVVIHRVIYGSLERFIGILTEHFAGAFPVWIAPVQAIVLPIADRHFEYAEKIKLELENANIRIEADLRTESIGRKIREAEMQKIPFMLIVGDKEIEANKIAVRRYGEGDKGQMNVEELIKEIL